MANFNQFLPLLLRFEGGFVDNPADPGGATNKGITLRTFSEAAEPLLGVPATLDNLKALSDEQAGVLYKHLYWDACHGDDIELQDLADLLVDFQVNAGANALKALQRVLNDAGAQPSLAVDGAMGPGTLQALRDADQREVYARLRQARIDYYRDLAERRPQLQCFLAGWLNRVDAFPVQSASEQAVA
jgi:lysozyme family protein